MYSDRLIYLWSGLFYGLLCGLEVGAICWLNGGSFVYSMDDPMIHLALAENIQQGHYGINLGVFSAPSSSILWPFLLVPLPWMMVPLWLNLLAGLGVVMIGAHLFYGMLSGYSAKRRRWGTVVLVLYLILASNLIALVFTGMEHGVQMLLTVGLISGLIHEQHTGRVPVWVIAVLVLGPLIRYENLALSVPALGYLVLRRHYHSALVGGGILALCMGGFSLFLYRFDLGFFPSSVVAKSRPVATGGQFSGLIKNVIENTYSRDGALILAGMFGLIHQFVVRKGSVRILVGWALVAGMFYIIAGNPGSGSLGRYDSYIMVTIILVLMYLHRDWIEQILGPGTLKKMLGVLGLVVLLLHASQFRRILITPIAANSIYEQHVQMHRFVRGYYQQSIAVNDLGWVSYRNSAYVLDLRGLGSRSALASYNQQGRADPDWMHVLVEEKDVGLVMIYASRFPLIPDHWTLLGKLHVAPDVLKRTLYVVREPVSMYAVDPGTAPGIQEQLRDFARTLPPGVRWSPE